MVGPSDPDSSQKKYLYVSMLISGSEGWGDSFPSLWFAEYLQKKDRYSPIVYDAGSGDAALNFSEKLRFYIRGLLWPNFYNVEKSLEGESGNKINRRSLGSTIRKVMNYIFKKKFLHSNYIEKPYFVDRWLSNVPWILWPQRVLVTHFNHDCSGKSWANVPYEFKGENAERYNGIFPPIPLFKPSRSKLENIFLDVNLETVNIWREGFRPTFPSVKKCVLNELEEFPGKYISLQGRRFDAGPLGSDGPSRNCFNSDEYDSWIQKFVTGCYDKFGLTVIFTSDYVNVPGVPTIDATRLSLWAKIKLHVDAEYAYVAHSGFGMIVTVYRQGDRVKGINLNRSAKYRNPPMLIFPNVFEKNTDITYTVSSPGYIDQYSNWDFDPACSLLP